MTAKLNSKSSAEQKLSLPKRRLDTTKGGFAPFPTETDAMNSSSVGASESVSMPTSTTRVCIKNLPPSFDEVKLKNHLLSNSTNNLLVVTDCKILKTKDGRSRKISFVGFKTQEMAQQVVSHFDKSFALTSRLSVSLAFSKKEGPPPTSEYRPWSKHSAGSSRYEKEQKQPQSATEQKNDKKKLQESVEDEELEKGNDGSDEIRRKRDEFLSTMGITIRPDKHGKNKENAVSKSKFWANDDAINVNAGLESIDRTKSVEDTSSNEGSNKSVNDDTSSSEDSSSSSDSDEEEAVADKSENLGKKVSSDLDFLKSKQVKADILSDDDDDDEDRDREDVKNEINGSSSSSSDSDESSSSSDDDSDQEEEKETTIDKRDQIASTEESVPDAFGKEDTVGSSPTKPPTSNTLVDRLFVRNLPFTTTEEELFEAFAPFGSVTSVHIPIDDSKRNKGYAFVSFESKHDAKSAMETMDGSDFQGRLIHILPARPSNDNTHEIDGTNSNMTYKERQELSRKKEAESSSQSWSASFLRGDAVVDNLSDRLGVTKGDLLNVKDDLTSGNAAVRLALGETHVVSENIAFFENHGVDVRAPESSGKEKNVVKRSNTMVLVKNLPYDTSLEELTKVFHSVGGDTPNIFLPPSKTAALVQYGHPTDARRAFRRLAYRKFKHVPLYLEWAPMAKDVKENSAVENSADNSLAGHKDENVVEKGFIDVEDPHAEAVEAGATQSIYVKNLNFSTSESRLKEAFEKAGFSPRAVRIPTKAAPIKKHKAGFSSSDGKGNSDNTKQVSMGFGFVEFASEEDAVKAMKSLRGKLVDGHALEIKLSTKNISPPKPSSSVDEKSSKNTKIMVRNVPFEATRSELLKLFGSFGQLKKVRLPKKFDGTHRGFAFCEFLTRKEAQNAMSTLSRTHLYGRHLVLEWAEGDDEGEGQYGVGFAREKAKRDVIRAGLAGVGRGGKKSKKF